VTNESILQIIFRHAQRAPEKVALHYLGHRITYGEFAYWIALARDFLARQDLRSGSIGALLCVPDVFDSWALRFALQSLGLTTLDLAHPDEIGAYNFKGVGCVITTIREQPIDVPDADYKLIRIPDAIFFGQNGGRVPEMGVWDAPMGGHILLTSGTTGFRKKVLRDPEGTSSDAKRRCAVYGISENSVFHALDFAPWTAAGYLLPIFAWSAGATAVCHRGKDLRRSFEIERITHALVTPMKLEELLASPDRELRFHPEMKLFVTAAPLTATLAAAAKSRFTPNIFQMLASTEGKTVALTRIEGPDDVNSHVLVGGSDVQIVDDGNQPLPAGQAGAIRVRPNDGVTGYLDDDEASRQFFRDGYFYPGDIGEIRPVGRLVLHGRTASTINLGGEKRPVEILEQRLQERLGLEGICLVSVRGPSLDDELHILVQSQRPIGKDEVTTALARVAELLRLPEAHVQFVKSIPRNEMGKIDRPAIRQKLSAMLAGTSAA
jgi:acyl-CoA synthetase (AMP-forming)/AMP-acid ligase II